MKIRNSFLRCIVVLAVAFAAGCDACSNTVIFELFSLDQSRKAVVFVRNCGATAENSTQVSILLPDQKLPSGAGNAFAIDGNHGAVPMDALGALDLRLRWDSNTTLVISYPPKVRILKQETSFKDITIRYESRKR